jgi:hypothetical protein
MAVAVVEVPEVQVLMEQILAGKVEMVEQVVPE